jgi:hypothetical protein
LSNDTRLSGVGEVDGGSSSKRTGLLLELESEILIVEVLGGLLLGLLVVNGVGTGCERSAYVPARIALHGAAIGRDVRTALTSLS